MRVGVTLQGVDDPATFGELARWIEQLGYDDLWLTDSSLHAGEVYVYATLALAATTRLRVGTAVTNPITRHPAITANAAATLHRLAPGRFVCGIGVGEVSDEYHVDLAPFLPGDKLVLYTDGVTETRDPSGVFYPLAERLRSWGEEAPHHLVEHLHRDLVDYSAGQLDDDIAALVAQRRHGRGTG